MRKLLPLVLCLALQACALPRSLPVAQDLRSGDAEVVVIGKVELVPPIDARHEQRTHWNVIGEKRILGRVLMATGGEYKPVNTSRIDVADFQGSVEAEWGVPFMVKAPRQRTFVNGALAHLDLVEQERLWFPGGYYFDVPRDAAAVYIGTLRYHRNEFNSITRVEVLDERKDVAAVLKAGASPPEVRPSLLKKFR
jgi:hypothetical protein